MIAAEAIKSAIAELRSNSRLRWGVWAIVGVLWLSGVLELRDQVGQKVKEHRAIGQKAAKAKAIAGQSEWIPRLEEAKTVQLAWEEQIWREGTLGLAQATFQDWLGQQVAKAGLRSVQLSVAAQASDGSAGGRTAANVDEGGQGGVPGLWKVSGRLVFDFQPQSFHLFLDGILSSERRVIVESLVIRGSPAPRAELGLVAYFQRPTLAKATDTPRQGAQK